MAPTSSRKLRAEQHVPVAACVRRTGAGITPSSRYLSPWCLARPSSIMRCARSRSARSPTSFASSTRRGRALPFAFEEHDRRDGPTLYEYRPLVGSFVEERADRLRGRDDALIALEELGREPAAAIYARAHAGRDPSADDALFRTILLDLLIRVAEACGGFDWDDESLRPGVRRPRAVALRRASRVRGGRAARRAVDRAAARALGGHSREAGRRRRARAALARGQGAPARRASAASPTATAWSSTASGSTPGEDVPDAPAEIADVVSAIRLATAAPLAAGPVLFETLDGRPYGIRPVLPIAATQPPGEPTKLDEFRASLAAELLIRLGLVDVDTNLAEALDRWELSLFQHEPFRSEQLRAALEASLGTTWPLRASILLETEPEARAWLHRELTLLADGEPATGPAASAVRRALVEVLRAGERHELVARLDRELLGVPSERPVRVAS